MSKNVLAFTRANLERLPPAAPGARAYYYDTQVDSLQVQVTDRGTKTYFVYKRISGRPRRVKLGRFPEMAPAAARNEARIKLGEIAKGIDPAEGKRAARAKSVSLDEAFEEYIKNRSLKPKTEYDYRNIINSAFEDWKPTPIAQITKDAVEVRHRRLGQKRGHAYANLAMRVLRAVFNYAQLKYEKADGQPLLPINPVKRLSESRSWYRVGRRETVIPRSKLPAWYAAVLCLRKEEDNSFAMTVSDYLLFLLFTGLRRSEAATLRWEDLQIEDSQFTVRNTKNHRDHMLPLSSFLVDLLTRRALNGSNSRFVFPNIYGDGPLVEPRKYVKLVEKHSGTTFTLHDLRRTFITVAESLDISAYALKRLLNHSTGQDVTSGYIIVDTDRLRDPMERISQALLQLTESVSD